MISCSDATTHQGIALIRVRICRGVSKILVCVFCMLHIASKITKFTVSKMSDRAAATQKISARKGHKPVSIMLQLNLDRRFTRFKAPVCDASLLRLMEHNYAKSGIISIVWSEQSYLQRNTCPMHAEIATTLRFHSTFTSFGVRVITF